MDMQHKSFTLSGVKSDDAARSIEGYAATFGNQDNVYDIIQVGAFAESLARRKPKMLAQHQTDCVIGMWNEITENANGLYVKGTFAPTSHGNDMYELAKMGAIDSMSIGYTVVDFEYDGDTGVRTIKKCELWEVSLVTFPANERAKITSVKGAPHGTPREFERFLRDVGGYSQKAAKKITAEGFKALDPQRDVDGDEVQLAEDEQALVAAFTKSINILRG